MEANRPTRNERRGICACAGEFLRWLLCLFLVTALLALAGLYVIQAKLDEEIRAHIETKFQEHYADLLVSVKSARRLPRGGLEVRGLSIAAPNPQGSPTLLAHVDELLVDCDASLTGLLSEDRDVRQVILRRLLLHAERDSVGGWNTSMLLPLPQFGTKPPPMRVESSIVAIRDPAVAAPWVLKNVDLQLNPVPPFPLLNVKGSFQSDMLGRVQFGGDVDLPNGVWSVRGQSRNLPVSAKTIDRLPAELGQLVRPLRSFDGLCNLDYSISSKSSSNLPFAFEVAGKFAGRVDDQRLPLQNVRIAFRAKEEGLAIESATASLGQAELRLSGGRSGWQQNGPLQLDLGVQRFLMTPSLRSALPATWRVIWDRFAPEGLVDASGKFGFDGRQWRYDVDIDCRGCSFAYDEFPYRLKGAEGRIHFENALLRVDNVRAQASGRTVQIDGFLNNPGPAATGKIEVVAREPIPIDERLISALGGTATRPGRPAAQKAVASLDPHGKISAYGIFRKVSPDQPFQKDVRIGIHDCSVVYDRFRYPIYGINGSLRMLNNSWTIERLEGVHDSGLIQCRGGWTADARSGLNLSLHFDAADVPLQDELRDALTPAAQNVWKQLRPRGTVDQLLVDVDYRSLGKQLDVRVNAHQRDPSQNLAGRSITVEPTWFPYRLDQVRGEFKFANGVAHMTGVSARHGPTKVRFDGEIQHSNGDWKLTLRDLHATRVFATHELVDALPAALGAAVAKLNVEGPLSIDGGISLMGTRGGAMPHSSDWSFQIDLENGRLRCGTTFDHVHGGVFLQGKHGPRGLVGRGEVEIDSVFFQGIQLTQVRGPMALNQNVVMFGERVTPRAGEKRPIVAHTLGGTLGLNARYSFGDRTFEVGASLHDGDLGAILRETTSGQHNISGRALGTIALTGTDRGLHTLNGRGDIQLRQADIYELPGMIRLLKLLRIRPPDETAFTSSDLQYRIEGDRIYFDRIDFDGDAISLEGRGEMDFNRVLNLTFDTSVGRDDNQPLSLILRPFLKEAGKRLMLIRVTGPIELPDVEPVPLPELNEGFQQVFQENARPARTATRLWQNN